MKGTIFDNYEVQTLSAHMHFFLCTFNKNSNHV